MDKPTAPAEPEAQGERVTHDWPAPPPGESLHKATLELWEHAKGHPGGDRLLGNVTAFSISALCEYSLNYAFKNASMKRAESELADARRQLQVKADLLQGNDDALAELRAKLQEAEAALETVKEDRRIQRVRAADAEIALNEAQAELAHTREAAAILRLAPGFEAVERHHAWLDRDQKRAAATTEEPRLAEALAHPPGPRHAQLVTPLDTQPLTRADVYAIVAEVFAKIEELHPGSWANLPAMVAEAAESKRGER